MEKGSRIYVAGHKGLVGSAVLARLRSEGYENIITRTSVQLDLRRQADTEDFFRAERPEYVFLAAARVGGILANSTLTADFIYDNTMIAANVIHSAYRFGTRKLLNLGSSCIYPRNARQPLKEDYLLTGGLEPTNEPYAVAKIAAIKMCRYFNQQYGTNFVSIMPSNLYGPNDNFDLNTSHVLPAMIRKFHDAAGRTGQVVLWGSGSPLREFLYVDDLADACLFVMKNCDFADTGEFINVGSGTEISIRDLAMLIAGIAGFKGEIIWDDTKPDGMMRKVVDTSRINELGWRAGTTLEEGIRKTYEWYVSQNRPEGN